MAEAASRFRQEQEMRLEQIITKEQEPANQRLVAVSKLATLIQITEVAIENTATKNPGFFNSSENKQKLSDSHARLAVARKLKKWLGGDETINFTQDEKILLSRSKNSVTMILKNSGINTDNLPSAPTPIGGGFCTIM